MKRNDYDVSTRVFFPGGSHFQIQAPDPREVSKLVPSQRAEFFETLLYKVVENREEVVRSELARMRAKFYKDITATQDQHDRLLHTLRTHQGEKSWTYHLSLALRLFWRSCGEKAGNCFSRKQSYSFPKNTQEHRIFSDSTDSYPRRSRFYALLRWPFRWPRNKKRCRRIANGYSDL